MIILNGHFQNTNTGWKSLYVYNAVIYNTVLCFILSNHVIHLLAFIQIKYSKLVPHFSKLLAQLTSSTLFSTTEPSCSLCSLSLRASSRNLTWSSS